MDFEFENMTNFMDTDVTNITLPATSSFCNFKRFGVSHFHFLNPARALRALGLLLADGAPTVGGGKTF